MKRNGNIVSFDESSPGKGISDTFDNFIQNSSWPTVKKFVSCSPNSGNHYEGETKTFTVTVDGYKNGNTVYYTIASVTGTVDTTDFSDAAISGSFTVNSSGVGSFSKTLNRDATSESESYKIQIRDGSVSGTILGESGTFTIPNPSYTLTASNSSPNEGNTVTFTLTGTNTYTGQHYYSMSGTAANSGDLSTLSGSFSYNGSTGSFPVSINQDYVTEGSETFTAQARVVSTVGPIVATATVTINDTSQTVSATCTPNVSSVNEGSSVTFTVNTTNFSSGTLNWDTVLSADMETSDISATSGTVSISGSTGSIVITATADGYTETGQTESFQVRVYDPNGSAMVTSSSVTINDTSTGTAEPAGGIFSDLVSLAQTLASATVPSPSNLQSIQSTIESANSAFNVFAVVGYTDYAESLVGTGVAGGKRTHTAKGFNYNTSSSNILSTGSTIANMTGGNAASLSVIDGKKWMAMAQFDGTNFDGILLWIFTGDSVNTSGTVTSGTRSVTNVKDIFYPAGAATTDYHHIYPVVIDPSGTVTSNTTSGASGWNFSNNQQPVSTTGYNLTTRFAVDDGQWGFRIPGYTDGNGGGTIFTTAGYGMGNQNSSDTNSNTYWNGTTTSSVNNLGFVFSGDA